MGLFSLFSSSGKNTEQSPEDKQKAERSALLRKNEERSFNEERVRQERQRLEDDERRRREDDERRRREDDERRRRD